MSAIHEDDRNLLKAGLEKVVAGGNYVRARIESRWNRFLASQTEKWQRYETHKESERAFRKKLSETERLARAQAIGENILLEHKRLSLEDSKKTAGRIRKLDGQIGRLGFFSKVLGTLGSASATVGAASMGYLENNLGVLPEYGKQLIGGVADALMTLGVIATHTLENVGIPNATQALESSAHFINSAVPREAVGPAVALGGTVAIVWGFMQRLKIREKKEDRKILQKGLARIKAGIAT